MPRSTSITNKSVNGGSKALLKKVPKHLPVTCSFGCVGTFRTELDRRMHMLYAHNLEPLRDVDDNEFRRPFFEGTGEVDAMSVLTSLSQKTSKRPASVGSLPYAEKRHRPSLVDSIRDFYTSLLKHQPSEAKHAYTKHSILGRSASCRTHNIFISSPKPDARTLEVAEQIAVDLETARRAFRHRSVISAEDVPSISSTGGTVDTIFSTPDRNFDLETTSNSSGSLYSPRSSMFPQSPNVHLLLLGESSKEKREAAHAPSSNQTAPSLTDSVLSTSDEKKAQNTISYSRPTPVAYPYLATLRATHASMTDLKQKEPRPPIKELPSRLPPPVSYFQARTAPPPLPTRSPARASNPNTKVDFEGSNRAIPSAWTLKQRATVLAATTRDGKF